MATEISYLDSGVYKFYQQITTEFKVEKDTAALVTDIIQALNNLAVSDQDKLKVNEALYYLGLVQSRVIVTVDDVEANIQYTLRALHSLLAITSADITGIRENMDDLLQVWEGRWYYWGK